jgi:hypothetical protein
MASCTAGQFFTVTYSGVTVPSPAGSPYTFITQTDIGPGGAGLVNTTAPFPTVTANPATLTVSAAGLTPDNKIYDGTTNATLVIGTPTLVGVIGADVVSLVTGSATGSFADKNIGSAKTVTIAGLTLVGANAGNYILTQPTRTANITKRPITVTAVTDTKTYDGTTNSTGVPTLSGGTPLAPGDTAPAWTQSFDNRNVGTGKTLTPAGAINDGNTGLNYAYTFAPNTSGVITPKAITVTAVTDTKTYDGTTNSIGVPTLSGGTPLAPGDVAPTWTQTFNNRNVGTGKALTPAGAIIDGNTGLNYAYNFIPVTTGIITAKPITGSFTAADKVYDGNTNATVLTRGLSGVLAADTANVSLTGGTASFGTATVGAGKTVTLAGATLTGSAAANYNLSSVGTTTAAITALGITGSFTAADKVYDGNTNATVLTRGLSGVLAPDTGNVSLTGGTASFGTATVGAGKTVTLAGATITGTAAANYNLSSVSTTTAAITAATLTVAADSKTKTVGAADPAFTASYVGFVNSETPAVLGGSLLITRATGETVGSYLITPSGLTSANYTITFNTGTLTITAASVPVILSLTGAGTTNAVITWSAVSNATYRVQHKPDLNTTNWTDLIGDVLASGSTASKTDIETTTNRFYRIQVLP